MISVRSAVQIASLGVTLAACAPSAATLSTIDYRTMIAQSLNYRSTGDARHFAIGEPWVTLTGIAVCLQSVIPDGRGGFTNAEDFTAYFFEDGRISRTARDNTVCRNQSYSRLKPAPT